MNTHRFFSRLKILSPRMSALLYLMVGMSLLSLAGCSVRSMMVREMVDALEAGMPAYEQETDLNLLEQAFPANIKLLETLLANQPGNDRLMVLLSRMYAAYAFSIFEEKLDAVTFLSQSDENQSAQYAQIKAAVSRYYLKGADYALSAIEKNHPGSRQNLSKVAKIQSVMDSLNDSDVPALFWYGFNLGGYVNRNRDSIVAVSKAHVADKAMHRVIELNPDYYHGSAHLFLMISYALRPPMMGGNPNKAEAHYRQLKSATNGHFLLGDVFYARSVLYRLQKKAEFRKIIDNIASRADQPKTRPLLDTIAIRRARIYLDGMDRLFD